MYYFNRPILFKPKRHYEIRFSIISANSPLQDQGYRSGRLPQDISRTTYLTFLSKVKNIGVTADMNSVEKSKLGIFNHLNFFQFITGIIVPVIGLIQADKFPIGGWIIVCLPALVSIFVLVLNSYHKHELALLTYFVLYPFFICINYMNGISLGIELSFILYGILSVFFIQDIGYMIFSICFSMVSYFFLVGRS